MKHVKLLFVLCLAAVGIIWASHQTIAAGQPGPTAVQAVVEDGLRDRALAEGSVEYLVLYAEKADLSPAYQISDWDARGWYVYDTLRGVAQASQADALAYLEAQKASGDVLHYRSHFILNAIEVRSGVTTLDALANWPGVVQIRAPKVYTIPEPIRPQAAPESTRTLEWGVERINADDVWNILGTRGEGIVVANIDTGVEYTHSALVDQYRGNLGGGVFDHNFNWWDPSAVCSPSTTPCDNNSHGTHTMGTMVGDDGGTNQIGVAPGAQWIAAKGCESIFCSEFALLSSAEWIAAPCPSGTPPGSPTCDPAQRPDVVNNSWGGGGGDPWYQASVDAWQAAGIFPAFSAGNSGPGGGTIGSPGDYCNVTASGATDINDIVASFSSRGPGNFPDCTDKPDVSAPGVNVRSSVPGNSYGLLSGTSMASPHTAGCMALLRSIDPNITYEQVYDLLTMHGVDLGAPGFDFDYGYGRIDCFAAAENLRPDFRLLPDPASQSVCVPDGADYTIDVLQIAGFDDPVTLSASGVPAGYSAAFDLNPVIPPGASVMSVTNVGAAAAGNYTIEVMGVAPTSTQTTTVGLNLYDAAPGMVTLTSPADGETNVELQATFEWEAAVQGDTYNLIIATDPEFVDIVYQAFVSETSHTIDISLAPLSTYYWAVQAGNPCGGGEISATFSFTTADIPPILLVDDDDNAPDVRSYYTEALDALAADYDIWDTAGTDNEPTDADLAPYSTVIWFTGVSFGGTAGPGASGETALGNWLENGNCMFISSQDYIFDRGITSFMQTYLGLLTGTSDVGQTNVTGTGSVFSGLGPYALSYPFTNYSDLLTPRGVAEAAFDGDQGVAAIDYISEVFQTTFWGFPFEAVPTLNDRIDAMNVVLTWCGAGSSTGLLQGSVTDLHSGQGIEGATITAEDSNGNTRTTSTNGDGNYSFALVVGSYDVTASADNYVPETVPGVEIITDTTTIQDFVLEGSLLTYAPDSITEDMEFGDVVTNTVTVTNTGPLPIDWSARISNYDGPNLAPVSIPASDGNFVYGSEPASTGRAPQAAGAPTGGNEAPQGTFDLLGGALAYSLQIDLNTFLFELASFSTDTPQTLNVIAGTGSDLLVGGDFLNGDFSTLYGLSYDFNQLVTIDTATGARATVGSTVPIGAHSWTGLAGDPSGTLYASSCDIFQTAIYTVDTGTGAATLVGTTATAPCLIAIAINADGQMYGHDIVTDSLYSVDKATGAATLIGSLGYDANFSQGGDFDEESGILYLAAYNNGLGRGELRIADLMTGATTLVGTFGPTGSIEVNSMAVATGGTAAGAWAKVLPESGTIPADSVVTIDVGFDARSLTEQGTYTAELVFEGTFVNEVPPMPLTMNLTCTTCGQLEGSITDAWTGDPVSAEIHITNDDGFDVTRTGDFYSVTVQPGTYTIDVTAEGYLPASETVEAMMGTTTITDFALTPAVGILEYAPASITEDMQFGDVVTNTVTVTNTGTVALEWSVSIGNYGGPTLAPISIPASDGSFLRGASPVSVGRAPQAAPGGHGDGEPRGVFNLLGGALAYGLQIDLNTFLFELASFTTDAPETLNVIAGTGSDLLVGGDFLNGDFSTLYGLSYDFNQLVTIDTATGARATVGSTVPIGAHSWTGLAGDPSGTLYASSCDIFQTAIYTVDTGTGAATLVGTTATAPCLIAIAINADGQMYGHDIVTDSLYSVDKATGAATLIGSLGYDANFSQGGDFDEESGILYLAAYNNGLGRGELRIADLMTGATTLVGTFGPTGSIEVNSMAVATGGGVGGWATAQPEGGVLNPGESSTFDIGFDSNGLQEQGTYTAEATFSGDFVNEVPVMPLTMNLTCPECAQLEGSITDAWTGDPLTADIHITGPGGFDLMLTGDFYSVTVQPGIYDFTVTADGYLQATGQAEAVAGMTTITDFALVPAVAILEYAPPVIEDTVAMGYSVSNDLVISNTGTIPFTFELEDFEAGYSPTVVNTICPPDSFGYTCTDSDEGDVAYNFEDIAGTGTPITLGDDQVSPLIPLGFTFNFYGTDYTNLYVSSNGFLSFTDASDNGCCTGDPIPSAGTPNTIIAAWWEDLDPGEGGTVHYQTLSTGAGNVFIVQFTDIQHFPSGNATTFQFKLFEGSNNIEAHYMTTPSDGGTHSVGIENQTGTVGLQYFLGTSGLNPSLAVCYLYPGSPSCGFGASDAMWATEDPSSGTVDPGMATTVEVIFDSSVITQTGTYTATLAFDGDFDNEVENGTLVMHVVEPMAAIGLVKTVGTDAMSCATESSITVWEGTTVYYCYTVTNLGNVPLPLHDLTDDQLGTIFTGLAYDLLPGESVDTVAAGLTISATIMTDTVNTATWVAYDNAGLSATAAATASVMVIPIEASITVEKTVGTDAMSCATEDMITVWEGTTVYYCYTVTNTGNYTLPLHDLTDDQLGTIFTGLAYELAPGASVDTVAAGLTISATVMTDTMNTATWTAYDDAGVMAMATDSAMVMVTPIEASITVEKTVGTDAGVCAATDNIQVSAGDTVYYCYTVTNTGNYTLPLHDLTDDQLGTILSGFAYDLAPGASVDTVAAGLTISATITSDTTNTATWMAYDDAGVMAMATDTATVTVAPTDVSLSGFGGDVARGWLPLALAAVVVTALGALVWRRRNHLPTR